VGDSRGYHYETKSDLKVKGGALERKGPAKLGRLREMQSKGGSPLMAQTRLPRGNSSRQASRQKKEMEPHTASKKAKPRGDGFRSREKKKLTKDSIVRGGWRNGLPRSKEKKPISQKKDRVQKRAANQNDRAEVQRLGS